MDYLPLPGTPVEDLDTPAIIVDLDIAESNIKAMADFAKENGVSMRPHMKTGKSPFWARKLMDAGAIGVCAAKVGEAEILADGGIREILIPNQVVGATKIRRLFGVSARSNVTVAVDSHENVAELSEAAQAFGIELGVILEVETGMNRAGVEPGEVEHTATRVPCRVPVGATQAPPGDGGGAPRTGPRWREGVVSVLKARRLRRRGGLLGRGSWEEERRLLALLGVEPAGAAADTVPGWLRVAQASAGSSRPLGLGQCQKMKPRTHAQASRQRSGKRIKTEP